MIEAKLGSDPESLDALRQLSNIEVDQKSGRKPISFFLRVLLSVISVLQAWRRLFFQQGSQAAICVTSISLNLSAVVIAWCPLGVTR